MTELTVKKIRDSKAARWSVVALVSFTMLCGYIITDVMAPLKTMLEQELNWTSSEYGLFTSGYGWLNVFVFMLIISGIILDKMGVRFTGISATLVMLIGTSIKYWAISTTFENNIITIGNWFSINKQVLLAGTGYAIFGVGVEAIGITATKAIVKWFKGKEVALALGLNVATARPHRDIARHVGITTYRRPLSKSELPVIVLYSHAYNRITFFSCILHNG